MTRTPSFRASTAAVSLVALMLAAQVAHAQSQVRYGRVTAVAPTTVDNNTGRNVGRVVGGGIGLASGSGQSSSNRALRTVGGAAVEQGQFANIRLVPDARCAPPPRPAAAPAPAPRVRRVGRFTAWARCGMSAFDAANRGVRMFLLRPRRSTV